MRNVYSGSFILVLFLLIVVFFNYEAHAKEYQRFLERIYQGSSYIEALRYAEERHVLPPAMLQRYEEIPQIEKKPLPYSDEIAKYDWNVDVMRKIAFCESEGDKDAINSSSREYSVGIFQINTFAHKNYTVEELKNVEINVREAYRIYGVQGYWAWYNCARKLRLI